MDPSTIPHHATEAPRKAVKGIAGVVKGHKPIVYIGVVAVAAVVFYMVRARANASGGSSPDTANAGLDPQGMTPYYGAGAGDAVPGVAGGTTGAVSGIPDPSTAGNGSYLGGDTPPPDYSGIENIEGSMIGFIFNPDAPWWKPQTQPPATGAQPGSTPTKTNQAKHNSKVTGGGLPHRDVSNHKPPPKPNHAKKQPPPVGKPKTVFAHGHKYHVYENGRRVAVR